MTNFHMNTLWRRSLIQSPDVVSLHTYIKAIGMRILKNFQQQKIMLLLNIQLQEFA